MKDQKDQQPQAESQSYLDKLEQATPTQVSQSIIAKILQKLKEDKKSWYNISSRILVGVSTLQAKPETCIQTRSSLGYQLVLFPTIFR